MAQRCSVVTNASVARNDDYESGRIAQSFGSGEMDGVQSADRFYREGASGAGEDRFGDTHDMTPPGERKQRKDCRALLLSRYPPTEAGTYHRAAELGQRECRCDPLSPGTN